MERRETHNESVPVSGRRSSDVLSAFEQRQYDRISILENQHNELIEKLTPMIDAFNAATRLGKWGTSLLVFLSVLMGVILGLIKIIQHK